MHDDLDERKPYVLALTSHRGGTGRTTLAAGLAWHFAKQGQRVALVDANPVAACHLLAHTAEGKLGWPNVQLIAAPHGLQTVPDQCDIIVIDCPPLTEPLCQQSLNLADGVLLCVGCDPASLISLPQATNRFKDWLKMQPGLELLGLVVPILESRSPVQSRCLLRMQEFENLLLEPPIPARKEFRNWPLHPGSDPPSGPANDALEVLAWGLLDLIQERATAKV